MNLILLSWSFQKREQSRLIKTLTELKHHFVRSVMGIFPSIILSLFHVQTPIALPRCTLSVFAAIYALSVEQQGKDQLK